MIPYLRFFTSLFIIVAALLPLNYFILREMMDLSFSTLQYGIYFYFIFIVSIIHMVMFNTMSQRPGRFVIAFMAVMTVKILLSLLLLIIMMKWFDNSKTTVVNYLLLYLSFSSFSVYQILKEQRRQKLRQSAGEVKKT